MIYSFCWNAKLFLVISIFLSLRYLQAFQLNSRHTCKNLWNKLEIQSSIESNYAGVVDGSAAAISSLIVYEDPHLVVVNKPSGYLSQAGSAFDNRTVDVLAALNSYLQREVSVIHRLDRPCSGLLVYGASSLATTALNELVQNRLMKKMYMAMVNGRFESGGWLELSHMIEKTSSEKVGIVTQQAYEKLDEKQRKKYARASLSCRTIRSIVPKLQQDAANPSLSLPRDQDYQTLIDIRLETGRKHQIRAQLANIGHAICGDKKYGAKQSFRARDISLHAYCLEFVHPVTNQLMRFRQEPPSTWRRRFGEEISSSINELLASTDGQ